MDAVKTRAGHLSTSVEWQKTGDPDQPYQATVASKQWRIRVNSFPDEQLYTLLIGGSPAESFDDWPDAWSRISKRQR